jgi:hypothetical protein
MEIHYVAFEFSRSRIFIRMWMKVKLYRVDISTAQGSFGDNRMYLRMINRTPTDTADGCPIIRTVKYGKLWVLLCHGVEMQLKEAIFYLEKHTRL